MSEDEKQIREMVEQWMAASKAGDTERVPSMVADDVVFLGAGRPPMTRAGFAAASAAQSQGGKPDIEGVSEIQEIKVLGDWAFMWTKLRVTIRPPGATTVMTKAGYTLSVLKKQNGQWVITRDANMLAPA
jgi:uncharacterized protein (TIGR02246 family)